MPTMTFTRARNLIMSDNDKPILPSGRPLPIPTHKTKTFFDAPAKERFLDHFMQFGQLVHAAMYANVSRQTVVNHMESDPVFGEMVADAKKLYAEAAIIEARRRALKGVDEPLSYQGKRTGDTINKKSDRLLERVLEAEADGYGKKLDVSHTHQGGILVVQTDVKSLDDWKQKFALPGQVGAEVVGTQEGVPIEGGLVRTQENDHEGE